MKPLRMQPTFRFEIDGPIGGNIARLRAAMALGDLGAHADAAGSCLDFRVPPEEQHLWSPHLSVQLSPPDTGTEVFGRFSPRPEVWTLVIMLYFAAAFMSIGGAIYGCVQVMLGVTAWALLAIPLGAASIMGLHMISLAGQRLSSDQIASLRERLDRVVAAAQSRQVVKK